MAGGVTTGNVGSATVREAAGMLTAIVAAVEAGAVGTAAVGNGVRGIRGPSPQNAGIQPTGVVGEAEVGSSSRQGSGVPSQIVTGGSMIPTDSYEPGLLVRSWLAKWGLGMIAVVQNVSYWPRQAGRYVIVCALV